MEYSPYVFTLLKLTIIHVVFVVSFLIVGEKKVKLFLYQDM
jgi:hypothetical protein